jgi:sialate O-acetylesterase
MKPSLFIIRTSVISFLLGTNALFADVKMPTIFGDHMVLQQDVKLPIWGVADAGEKVTVSVGGKTIETTTGPDGKWRVDLDPLPATTTATTMTVTGKNTLKFDDVLIGEVWFCAGQSNMGFVLNSAHNASTEIPKANDPQLRYFHVSGGPALEPSTALKCGQWELCTPGSAPNFSAVGYFFARELRANLNRPVGLIVSAWGGTTAESWTPIPAYAKEPELKVDFDRHAKALADFPKLNAEYPDKMSAWAEEQTQWKKEYGIDYDNALKDWQAAADAAKAAGQPAPPKPKLAVAPPQQPARPDGGTGIPGCLFNGVVAPVIPYAIKGVAWYQGESNAGNAAKYQILFPALIKGWREFWGQGDFPFIFVQLPKFIQGQGLPLMREVQSKTLALPETGMTTIIDIGDPNNIHPTDKIDVGTRLSLVARHLAYGQDIVWSGPVYDSMKVEGNSIRVQFTQTGGGLIIGTAPWTAPNVTPLSDTTLEGFAIAGEDKQWVKAEAKIDGNTVVVSSEKVPTPVAVRYAWEPSPSCNLYNKEGLAASPFRSDNWPR